MTHIIKWNNNFLEIENDNKGREYISNELSLEELIFKYGEDIAMRILYTLEK